MPQISLDPQVHAELLADVREGLQSSPQKRLSPRFFYDGLGSRLFDAICLLPWYPISVAEKALLARHADAILDHLPGPLHVVELGPGNGEKLDAIVTPLLKRQDKLRVGLVDVSGSALDVARIRFSDRPQIDVQCHQALFQHGLADAAKGAPDERRLVLFLGSNLGNFAPPEARRLLRELRESLQAGDALLLGIDLVKSADVLEVAYNDPLGVTAAFNKNLLLRINQSLQADFDLRAFHHQSHWNAEASRVEMHLVSDKAQKVRIPAAGLTVSFAAQETIWTESSYKYTIEGLRQYLGGSGFAYREHWADDAAGFADVLFEAI
jgi:L-histidine Nalpha-methyltransferase